MLNTKIILVDGITGSGKSTASHYITRQMKKNGIKVKWFHEGEKDNPLLSIERNENESVVDFSKRVMIEYPRQWIDFADKIKDDDFIYIIDGYLFLNVLFFPHFIYDIDWQTIKEYSHKLLETISYLNPVLIHFYQNDVDKALMENWDRRGHEWTNYFISGFENTLYCKNRNIKGKSGVIKLWQDYTDYTLELFNELNFRKIQIENSAHDWDNYKNTYLNFLQIRRFKEVLYLDSYKQYFGFYKDKGSFFRIHEKNNRLCINAFQPNLKLVPITDNEFEMEGFHISIKFYKDETSGHRMMKFIKSSFYYAEGNKYKEFTPYELNTTELEEYCGEYLCKANKLTRKIYMQNGKLYYWRDKSNESQILPLTKTQLMMSVRIENQLNFNKINDKWQFPFDVKGDNPSSSLYVLKN
ncbi:MAG: hypothetical protein GQ534_01815 [Candidatus Delongbacteria bacterium]|nr:hypothetical protein [Candidatus Delongbacteria bacterium]